MIGYIQAQLGDANMRQVARDTGIDYFWLTRLRKGLIANPKVNNLILLRDYFMGVDADNLRQFIATWNQSMLESDIKESKLVIQASVLINALSSYIEPSDINSNAA